MSYTETHTGKLIPIKTINNHAEFICFVRENDLIDDRTMPIEEFLDEKNIGDITNYPKLMFLCEWDEYCVFYKYCFYKNVIYKFDKYKQFDSSDYLNEWNLNQDDSINFTTMFCNGCTGFGEVLEDALDKINSQ